MNYPNEMKAAAGHEPMPVETMTNVLHDVSSMTTDLLNMALRVNGHLFGKGCIPVDKETDPTCFEEELKAVRTELLALAEEMSKMCCLIGV